MVIFLAHITIIHRYVVHVTRRVVLWITFNACEIKRREHHAIELSLERGHNETSKNKKNLIPDIMESPGLE